MVAQKLFKDEIVPREESQPSVEHIFFDRNPTSNLVIVGHDPLEDVQPQRGRKIMHCLLQLIRAASNIEELGQFSGHQGSQLERPM